MALVGGDYDSAIEIATNYVRERHRMYGPDWSQMVYAYELLTVSSCLFSSGESQGQESLKFGKGVMRGGGGGGIGRAHV